LCQLALVAVGTKAVEKGGYHSVVEIVAKKRTVSKAGLEQFKKFWEKISNIPQ
jgi:hypothetical protein